MTREHQTVIGQIICARGGFFLFSILPVLLFSRAISVLFFSLHLAYYFGELFTSRQKQISNLFGALKLSHTTCFPGVKNKRQEYTSIHKH